MRDIVIVGCGGFGRETADVVDAVNRTQPSWNLVGFVDDSPSPENLDRIKRRGCRYLGTLDELEVSLGTRYVIGIGSPAVRRRLTDTADAKGLEPATLVHPTANLGANVVIGKGSVIAGHVDIGSDASIGHHVHLDRGVQVGHDSLVEDFVTVHPQAAISGTCRIGTGAEMGTNSTLLPGVVIGPASVIGAAACAVRDVPEGATVKGVPAR